MNHEQGLYLEDLYVGQRFTSGTYRMDEERIKAFAAEFDPQPFHLDQVAAQATVFGGVVRERVAYRRCRHAAYGHRRVATGQWDHRARRRVGMAQTNQAGRYPAGEKRGPRDSALPVQTKPGGR